MFWKWLRLSPLDNSLHCSMNQSHVLDSCHLDYDGFAVTICCSDFVEEFLLRLETKDIRDYFEKSFQSLPGHSSLAAPPFGEGEPRVVCGLLAVSFPVKR